MNQQKKIKFIISTLESLYPSPLVPLKHQDAYTLLIAVLLSARCTDERVNQVTPDLFNLANNPGDMMNKDPEKIKEIIRPCGLSPFKSKSIHQLSKILFEQYNSIVPANFESLESLPGVGHKTASVVMSQAFNIPTFPVDTHIHRLSYRWCVSNGKNVIKTEKDCKRQFPKSLWSKLHLQMIYFGREYCPARTHHPEKCPICSVVGRKSLFK
ncbi:MAG: endonuclease III [Flavobacteriales bacterium]|jgi:endonuclease-3|nr:endonuclease III [Flavobacteriales bacterium]|tara:strand:- start:4191 stop:4826 length:636 start_codon:yes stop_codon:yes gene_type:complete